MIPWPSGAADWARNVKSSAGCGGFRSMVSTSSPPLLIRSIRYGLTPARAASGTSSRVLWRRLSTWVSEHTGSRQGGFLSVDAEIVVDLPAADALMVALPLVAFHLQVIRRIVGAKSLCDHLVPLQVVEGLAQRGGQKANAALP
jgi:hypothetical protein